MLKKKEKLATIKEVAVLAGVSPATVSRVFDAKWEGKVSDRTKSKVLSAAQQLSYYPNAIARSLHIQRTNIVAIVMGTQVGYFFEEIFFEISKKIQSSGRQVLMFIASPEQGLDNIVNQVLQYRVDAILIMASATSMMIVEEFEKTNTPIILFDRQMQYPEASNLSFVCSDNVMGARMAADFLLENGHRQIGYVSGDASSSQSLDRSYSFINRVKELGGKIVARYEGDFTYEAGKSAMRAFSKFPGLDAVFCADDTMAMGVMDQARKLGLSVPEDLSVMGFDNHSVAQMDAYALTTVAHRREELYQAILTALELVIENPDKRFFKSFPMDISVRRSVKKRV